MVLCKDDNGDGPFSKSLRIWTHSEEPQETNLYTGKYKPTVILTCFIIVYF